MFRSVGLVAFAVLAAGCDAKNDPGQVAPSPDRLPSGWVVNDLASAAGDKSGPTDVRVLVWQIMEDDRPLYVESCVVWLHWKDGRDYPWRLAHLYRHPKDQQPPPEWRLSMVWDVPYTSRQEFDHPPTNADVNQFLKDTWWKFEPEDRWRLLDAAVCVNTWREVIGEEPTKFYDERLLRKR